MTRRARGCLAAGALLAALSGAPAAAGELETTIDLDYTYRQDHLAGDVTADTAFKQKYEARYMSSGSLFDYNAAVRLELEDAWHTRDATNSRIAPSIEFGMVGAQSALKASYQATLSTVDPYLESEGAESYSQSFEGELQLIPAVWPEVLLKVQQRREYEELASEKANRWIELGVLKDFDLLRLEYRIKREETDDSLPTRASTDTTQWTGRATLRSMLTTNTDFELAYEVTETYTEKDTRGVPASPDEEYTQKLRARVKNTQNLTARLAATFQWEYEYDQDLLDLEYDYKFKNKYGAALRYDFSQWVKLGGELRRETEHTMNLTGVEDEEKVTDKAAFTMDAVPWSWLRFAGRAEYEWEDESRRGSGGSIDQTLTERYEGVVRNSFGDSWEFILNGATKYEHVNDWLTSQEAKLKAEALLRLYDLYIRPTFESTRLTEWDEGVSDPRLESLSREGRIRLEYRRQFLQVLQASFSHEYGMKEEEVLDGVLNFDSTTSISEDTRFYLAIVDLVPDLRLEGEIDRKAADTEDDAEPMAVDVLYSLKFDWRHEQLSLSASFQYNDKGNQFDDMTLNSKAEWRGDKLALSGEYRFEKTFSEETDEGRTLNLKLTYRF